MTGGMAAHFAGLSSSAATALLSVASAIIWGTSDFAGGIAARRLPSSAVVMLSHALSLVLLVSLALATSSPLPDAASTTYGLIAGITCGLGVMVLYKALALGAMGITAAVSGVLAAVLPVAWAFATEGLPRPMQVIGFVLAIVAIWIIAAEPGGAPASSSHQGIVLGAIAGISFGCLFILLKLAGRGGVLWPLAYSRLVSCSLAACVTLYSVRRSRKAAPAADVVPPGIRARAPWITGSLLGILALTGAFDAWGNSFYTLATRLGRLDIAAVLGSLYPASTILLAALLLKERTTPRQTAGMVLALVAVILISA